MKALIYIKLALFSLTLFIAFDSKALRTEERDVVIVGGGLSGLVTSMPLEANGVDYALFEAKDSLGGRTYSVRGGDGTVYNMGGEWIESDDKRMIALAKALGLDLQKETYDHPILVSFGERTFSPQESRDFLESILQKLAPVKDGFDEDHLRMYAEDYATFRSLAEVLPDTLTDDERRFIETYLEGDSGSTVENLVSRDIYGLYEDLNDFKDLFAFKTTRLFAFKPTRWLLLNRKEYQYRVVGGMSRMIEAMSGRIDNARIHLRHVLQSVSRGADGRYRLFFDDGGEGLEVFANAVVMTIPFTVLRGLDLDASLGLSALARTAIDRLSYGTNAKIQVPFAPGSRPNEDYRYFVDGDTKTMAWNPVSGATGTTLFLGGDQGGELTDARAEELADHIVESLGAERGAGKIVKKWADDEFALGSYSAMGPNDPHTLAWPSTTYEGMMQFAEPSEGFVFAGEHTRIHSGYMESAVQSGEAAAQYILENRDRFTGGSSSGAGAAGE